MSIIGPTEDEVNELVMASTQLDIKAIDAIVEAARSDSIVSDDASGWKPGDATL
jgi:hypothetical protein